MTFIQEKQKEAREWAITLSNSKDPIANKVLLDKVDTLIATTIQDTLKNVPVEFVRQWINEDLLKDGHPLVTNEQIQSFIDIARLSEDEIIG